MSLLLFFFFFFFSSRRRHTRSKRDWSSDVCSSDLQFLLQQPGRLPVECQRFLVLSADCKLRHSPQHRHGAVGKQRADLRSEEHTSELQSRFDLVCRLLLEKKKIISSDD